MSDDLLDRFQPATDNLIVALRTALNDTSTHDHEKAAGPGDLYCLNLTSFMGERMGPVLRRLADAEGALAAARTGGLDCRPASPVHPDAGGTAAGLAPTSPADPASPAGPDRTDDAERPRVWFRWARIDRVQPTDVTRVTDGVYFYRLNQSTGLWQADPGSGDGWPWAEIPGDLLIDASRELDHTPDGVRLV